MEAIPPHPINMASWIPIPPDSDFSLDNLPFGIISTADDSSPRVAVAVGDHVVDMKALEADAAVRDLFFGTQGGAVFAQPTLNAFAALGRPAHRRVRRALQGLLRAAPETLRPELLRDSELRGRALHPLSGVAKMHLPFCIGDYTDFYAGVHHARAVGTLFRGAANALPANYETLPIAYHGRASSVVVSGAGVRRPWGQVRTAAGAVVVQPSRKLDYELELGCFVGGLSNTLGAENDGVAGARPIGVAQADAHIFGYVLLNDWSARDIQSWEYVPLGPFSGKNFGTTISPWVVLADALAPLHTPPLPPRKPLLPYLDGGEEDKGTGVFRLQLEVDLAGAAADGSRTPAAAVARVGAHHLQWSFPQMLAQHTLGGCRMRTGDLLGSGTISGPGTTGGEGAGDHGSLLEASSNGQVPVSLGNGLTRTFLEDGDTVTMRGYGVLPNGNRVGFGACVGTVVAALEGREWQ